MVKEPVNSTNSFGALANNHDLETINLGNDMDLAEGCGHNLQTNSSDTSSKPVRIGNNGKKIDSVNEREKENVPDQALESIDTLCISHNMAAVGGQSMNTGEQNSDVATGTRKTTPNVVLENQCPSPLSRIPMLPRLVPVATTGTNP